LQAAFLVLLVGWAYYPTLFVPARADQFVYLHTTAGKKDFFSLALGCYSWNRDLGGDTHLFRPVLFFLLGVEQWAFSPAGFFAWQLTNLLLHLAVVGLLFCFLLLHDRPGGWLAFAAAGFFGVQYASMELVAWHHLGGYLLFCVFMTGVFCLLGPAHPHPRPEMKHAAVVLLLLLSAFTMEFGNVLAAVVAAYMLVSRMRGRRFHALTIAAAAAVPVVYTAANFTDQVVRYGRVQAGPAAEGRLGLAEGCAGVCRAAGLWVQSGLIPSLIDLGADSRMSIVRVRPAAAVPVQAGLAALAGLAFLTLAARSLRRGGFRPPGLACAAGLFAACYAGVLVFLRAGPRGLEAALASNSYYAYIFNLAVVLFLFPLIRLSPRGAADRLARVVLGGALATIGMVSAGRVHEQGRAEARWGRPVVVLVEQVRQLRAAAGGEGFTFGVGADHPGEWELPFVGRGPDGRAPTVAAVLFPREYTRRGPRWVLWRRYHGFDIVSSGGRFFAFPSRSWPRDLPPLSGAITGTSAAGVMRAIDGRRSAGRGPLPGAHFLQAGGVGQVELQRGDADVPLGQGGDVGVGDRVGAGEVRRRPEVDPAARVGPAVERLDVGGQVLRPGEHPLDRAAVEAGDVDVEQRPLRRPAGHDLLHDATGQRRAAREVERP
jgi:hypothetical protein